MCRLMNDNNDNDEWYAKAPPQFKGQDMIVCGDEVDDDE